MLLTKIYTILITLLFATDTCAQMVVFEEYNGIKASEINQNFMYIKNVLEGKNIDANFNTFYSGQVIAKALLEVEFDKLRSMGIEVSNIESNEIKASELNKAFQDMLSAASVANDIPVVSDISISTNEDINYLGVFVVDNITGENNVEIISPPSHGTVIVGLNKSFTYIPQLNYNGSDSFSFRVYDGTSYSNIGLVSINVNPVNDMPVAQSISFNLNEDGSYSGNLSASDVDNDILSYSLVSQASKGSVTINSNGSFAYIAGLNQTGSDSFSFKVNDGKSDSNVSVVSITINAVNDAPVANNGSFSVQEDSGLYSDSVIVSDVELSTLTYSLVSSTNKGVLVFNNNGTFTYTPSANNNGSDSFTFKANDGTADSNVATISITINAVNDIPVIQEQTIAPSVAGGVINSSLTASDIDNDSLGYSVVANPNKGNITLNSSTGSFTYTPLANTSGYDEFTVKVNDGTIDSVVKKIQVNISPIDVSCDAIKARGFASGYYGIDLDGLNFGANPVSLYCDFSTEANQVWTQVARVNLNQNLWNAWSGNHNNGKILDTESFGVRMQQFTNNATGRDLEVMIKVDGVVKNVIYYDVRLSNAFNPIFSTGSNATIQNGIFYRSLTETSYTRCESTFVSSNAQWNWSIADSANTNCGGYGGVNKGGFILAGNNGTTEQANIIYGLNQYDGNTFSNIEIFIKKRQLSLPISCQHAFDNGIISSSGLNSIDVDSNGTGQTIHCEVSGSSAYTLLVNFGNNSRYSNRGVLRNGVTTNSSANVSSAGFVTNANNWNNTDYPTSTSYLQFFNGGSGTGYIRVDGPKWGGEVWSYYQALNGSGQYARFRIIGDTRDSIYGVVGGNSASTQIQDYFFKNNDILSWEEYPTSVIGIYYIFIK